MPRGESTSRRSSKREPASGTAKTEREPRQSAPEKAAAPQAPQTLRVDNLDPIQLFTLLPIRVYQHVAEVGAGHGYLSVPLAKYAYEGKVYAVDSDKSVLQSIAQSASQSRLSNVATAALKDDRIDLPDGSVDGVVISPVLHSAKDPVALLKDAARILRADGWITVIEWIKSAGNGGPATEDRIARERAVKLAEEASLRVLSQRNLNSYFYYLVVKKRQ